MDYNNGVSTTMAPQDDLFIEPANADDYDIVYGDYNTTMTDYYSSPIGRPYIRLNSILPNITKEEGGTVKLRCEAAGSPLPIRFEWFRNHAPLERRKGIVTIRTRDFWSRVKISGLKVLDSGFYMCKATNAAGSVNTTAIVKIKPTSRRLPDDVTLDHGRPSNSDRLERPASPPVPSSPGGWKDWEIGRNRPHSLPAGTCILYEGQACREWMQGQRFMLTSNNPETLLDIERNLRAAMMFISNSSDISPKCKRLSHQVACLHNFHLCDPHPQLAGATPDDKPPTLQLCQSDCENVQDVSCPAEYKLASDHDLIGTNKLLPSCAKLPQTNRCIPVLESGTKDKSKTEDESHWCFVGAGRSYRGTLSTTRTGRRCLAWSDSKAEAKGYGVSQFPSDLGGASNYCRNPGGHKAQPWCFGADGKEEYCHLQPCPPGLFPALREMERTHQRKPIPDLKDEVKPVDGRGTMTISELWSNLAPQWQYAVIGGASVFLLLLLILIACIYCKCCRKKRRNTPVKSHLNGSSLLSNGVYPGNHSGSTYLGPKMNGTPMSAHQGAASYELTSLLPPPPSRSPPPPAYYGGGSATPSDILPPEIPFKQLRFDDSPLGEGVFGKVCKGELLGYSGADEEPIQVMIKCLREEALPRLKQDFEREVAVMSRLRHTNIVEMIGVCLKSTPNAMIFEFMIHGTLHEFLRLRSPYSQLKNGTVDKDRMLLDHTDFLHISTQIAAGMEYLSSCHYVHRDLASRNCLVTDRLTIKISDFGVIRDSYKDDYLRMQNNAVIPIRWMPPEAIFYGKYSEESDVWSYGVTLWEIYSYGAQPFGGYSNEECMDLIRNRCLLASPTSCPSRLYSLMVECWHEVSSRRPRFCELHGRLQTWSVMSSPAQSSAMTGLGHPPRSGSVHSGTSVGRISRQSSSQQSSNWHSTPVQMTNAVAINGNNNNTANNNHNGKQHQHHFGSNNVNGMSPAMSQTRRTGTYNNNNAYNPMQNNSFEVESTTSGD